MEPRTVLGGSGVVLRLWGAADGFDCGLALPLLLTDGAISSKERGDVRDAVGTRVAEETASGLREDVGPGRYPRTNTVYGSTCAHSRVAACSNSQRDDGWTGVVPRLLSSSASSFGETSIDGDRGRASRCQEISPKHSNLRQCTEYMDVWVQSHARLLVSVCQPIFGVALRLPCAGDAVRSQRRTWRLRIKLRLAQSLSFRAWAGQSLTQCSSSAVQPPFPTRNRISPASSALHSYAPQCLCRYLLASRMTAFRRPSLRAFV